MAKEPAPKLATGDTAYLYRAAIGPRAQDYYLRHFARFDGDGKAGASWNWSAYWTTFNWLVYRKMWGWALAYVAALLGLALLVFGVGKLLLDYSDTTAVLLSLALLTAAFVLPGLYANAWFYSFCNEQISAVLRTSPEVKDAATILAHRAPDNRRLLLLGLFNAVLLAAVLGMANWFQTSESALPQLASREEHPLAGGQSGQVRPLAAAASAARADNAPVAAASTPAPAASASAPARVTSAPAAAPLAPAPEPRVAQAASVPAAPSRRPAEAADKPVMVQATNRSADSAAAPVRAPRAAASAPAAAPRPSASAPAPRLRHVWVIQVGAYAQAANAQKALAQVQELGLEAGAESFDSPKGKLTRVRVGPFTRQAEADQAALRIKALDLPTLVIRQRP